jgi:hypothetical protein
LAATIDAARCRSAAAAAESAALRCSPDVVASSVAAHLAALPSDVIAAAMDAVKSLAVIFE